MYILTTITVILFTFRSRLTARGAMQHKWLVTAQEKILSKTKLKRWVIKRRWIKAVNTILAITRMGAKLGLMEPNRTGCPFLADKQPVK